MKATLPEARDHSGATRTTLRYSDGEATRHALRSQRVREDRGDGFAARIGFTPVH